MDNDSPSSSHHDKPHQDIQLAVDIPPVPVISISRAEENYFAPPSMNATMKASPRKNLHIFHVRKTENVFDKFGAKKPDTELRVDLASRTLTIHFHSSHSVREVYSCMAIRVRLASKLGVHFKINVPGSGARVTKKVMFLTELDREHFLTYMEETQTGTSSGNESSLSTKHDASSSPLTSTANPYYPLLLDNVLPKSSSSPSHVGTNTTTSTGKASPSTFPTCAGENILERVENVTQLMLVNAIERAIPGILQITNYAVSFTSYDAMWSFGAFELPLAAIECMSKDGLMVTIQSKNFRTLRLAMHDALPNHHHAASSASNSNHFWIHSLMLKMRSPLDIRGLFAFEYHLRPDVPSNDGWQVYEPHREYTRLALSTGSQWRLLDNSRYHLCPTYPATLVVPTALSEDQLVSSASFRSKSRLPVVTWRHSANGAVLSRSSQPRMGVTNNRCEADRQLLRCYREAAMVNDNFDLVPAFHIVDARKPMATHGNRLIGKGVENSQHYDGAIIEYMRIANIHRMRESFHAFCELLSPNHKIDEDKNYYSNLDNTRWLKHILRILSGASRVAEILHEQNASVLVHCSDGWDRTPALVATAQLILDPYYRTIRGFAVLVEKEWCSFGHRFADRVGVAKMSNDCPQERSPAFLQWIDCVWQMVRQKSEHFEFTSKFLIHILDGVTSGKYGTFLGNYEKDRKNFHRSTTSIWTPVLMNIHEYQNPLFIPTRRPIFPKCSMKKIALWDEFYTRWDPENQSTWNDYISGIDSREDFDELEVPTTVAPNQNVPNDDEEETKRDVVNPVGTHADPDDARVVQHNDVIDDEPFVEHPEKIILQHEKTLLLDEGEEDEDVSVESYSSGEEDQEVSKDEDDLEEEEFITSGIHHTHIGSHLDRQFQSQQLIERTRQRAQAQNIRQALGSSPHTTRCKYLEQLLSESIAREFQLEATLSSVLESGPMVSSPKRLSLDNLDMRAVTTDSSKIARPFRSTSVFLENQPQLQPLSLRRSFTEESSTSIEDTDET